MGFFAGLHGLGSGGVELGWLRGVRSWVRSGYGGSPPGQVV
jgi:hypothetical protein